MNWYQKLKAEQGEAVANAKMREMRAKVKNLPGGSFRDPEFARAMSKKGVEARKNHEAGNRRPTTNA